MTTYRFLGRIIDQITHRGLSALRVEAGAQRPRFGLA